MTEDLLASVVADLQDKMEKAAHHVQEEFSGIRTGRATPVLVEKLKVDYYGTDTPLQQLASFSVPEARVLVISPYDKSAMKAIERAIINSDLGMAPSNDGQVIRLMFPALTQERRKEFVKLAKNRAEDGKVAVRNIRRHARTTLEKAEKEGTISADDLKRAEKDLDKITDSHISDIERLLAHKEAELLEV